jgi:small-conductance mechanosensitive channel
VWITQIRRRYDATSDLHFAVDKAFRENGVEIPFPQRDLHVRSWAEHARPAESGAVPKSDTPSPTSGTSDAREEPD